MNTTVPDPNFLYVTGFTSGLFEYNCILLDKEEVTLFTNPLEYEIACEQGKNEIKIVNMKNGREAQTLLTKEFKNKIIGTNGSFLPYASYKRIKDNYKPKDLVDVSDAFSNVRLVKDNEEVSFLRKAASITKMTMLLIQKEFKEGMTEIELASRFDQTSSSLGSQEPSFKTIVCFGKNAAMPHHAPDQTKLKYGDIILIDAGAKVDNYCSDITRTYIFGNDIEKIGDYDKKLEIYNTVKEAQLNAIKEIKASAKAKDIHMVAENYINKSKGGKYKGTFIHSLGHSLGIEVHDGERLSKSSKLILKPGMIMTVEPGIYISGFGGVRIEDDVLVTKEGAIVL